MHEVDINKSMTALISFMTNLKTNIARFRQAFTKVYTLYIEKTLAASKSKKISKENKKYQLVTNLYIRFMKLLDDFMKSFTTEYSKTLSIAIEISNLKETYNDIYKRYPNFDILDTDLMNRLETRVRKIIDRYNKLASTYNTMIRQFEVLKGNILNGSLVYTSAGQDYAVSVNDKLIRFQQIIESDVAIKQKSIKAQESPPQTLPSNKKEEDEDEDNGDSNTEKLPTPRGAKSKNSLFKKKLEIIELKKELNNTKCNRNEYTPKVNEFIDSVLSYNIKTLQNYIQILKNDKGNRKVEDIVEKDILKLMNSADTSAKTKKTLINDHNHVKAKHYSTESLLKNKCTEIEALIKSADILSLLDEKYELQECERIILIMMCISMLKKFDEEKKELKNIIEKISINDNVPRGDEGDYYNLSPEGKNLLMQQEIQEQRLKNAINLIGMAIDKLNNNETQSTEPDRKMQKIKCQEFVNAYKNNVEEKIDVLKQKVDESWNEVLSKPEDEKSPVRQKNNKDSAISEPTPPQKKFRSLRLNALYSYREVTFDSEFLKEIVDKLHVLMDLNIDQSVEPDKQLALCQKLNIMKVNFNKKKGIEAFLINKWKEIRKMLKISAKYEKILNSLTIPKIQAHLTKIESTRAIVSKISQDPLAFVVIDKTFKDKGKLKTQVQYLSLALIMVYLQVEEFKEEQKLKPQDKIYTKKIIGTKICFKSVFDQLQFLQSK